MIGPSKFSITILAAALGSASLLSSCGSESARLEGEEWVEAISASDYPWRVEPCSDYLITAICGGDGSKGFEDPGELPSIVHVGDTIRYVDTDQKERTFGVRNISMFTYTKDLDTVYGGQRFTAKKGDTTCTLYAERSRAKIVENQGWWSSTIKVKGCSIPKKPVAQTSAQDSKPDLILMTPSEWAGLDREEQDLFTVAVLESWSFALYSYESPELQDFVACVNAKKIDRFHSLVWYLGNVKESAVRDITSVTPTICKAYKGKGSSRRTPLKRVTRSDWDKFTRKAKVLYLKGYLETAVVLHERTEPQQIQSLRNCIDGEGVNGILSRVVNNEPNFEWEYPVPWSIATAVGQACQKYRAA